MGSIKAVESMAQYFKVGVHVMSHHDGKSPTPHSVVRLEKQSSGWMGGAIGAARTTKNLEGLRDELGMAFQQAGVLVGVTNL